MRTQHIEPTALRPIRRMNQWLSVLLKDTSVSAGDSNPHSVDQKHQSLNLVLLTTRPRHFQNSLFSLAPNLSIPWLTYFLGNCTSSGASYGHMEEYQERRSRGPVQICTTYKCMVRDDWFIQTLVGWRGHAHSSLMPFFYLEGMHPYSQITNYSILWSMVYPFLFCQYLYQKCPGSFNMMVMIMSSLCSENLRKSCEDFVQEGK